MFTSSDLAAGKPHGKLEIRSRAGVEFRLLDSRGVQRMHGTGDVDLDLPEGLYSVEWLTAGSRNEVLVRVLADAPPAVVAFDVAKNAPTELGIVRSAPEHFDQLKRQLPTQPPQSAGIVVIVSAERAPAAAFVDLKLSNMRNIGMTVARDSDPLINPTPNEAAQYYPVPPGDYLLAFRSVTGETLQQTVPALRGRCTLVFLSQVSGRVLVADGTDFKTHVGTGIDVARSVIITAAGDESDERIRERARLARVLLHDIASNGGSLGADFQVILDDPKTDPLLRMLAVIVIIARLKAKQSPTPDHHWPTGSAARSFAEGWADQAVRWLAIDKGYVVAPDETVARWHLGQLLTVKRQLRARRSIAAPPMLAQVWRWAVAQSVEDPQALPLTPPNVAAARSAVGAELWLCWKASAAKAPPVSRIGPSKADITKLVADVVDKASKLSDIQRALPSGKMTSYLSPEAAADARVAIGNAASTKGDAATKMAVSLAIPGGALQRRLTRVDQEIGTALEQLASGAPSETSEKRQAPGLSQPITHPDDPQKGRFGGTRQREGFTLDASFSGTKSPNWTRITLEVAGLAGNGDIAQFILHDSFQPEVREAEFHDNLATLTVTAWGGFTVGVWLPKRNIELELDLVELETAPRVIKVR